MGSDSALNARGKSERKAAAAYDKAFNKSEQKMGLTGIIRGLGGEVISGIDPATGKRIAGDELNKRREMIAAANKAAADAKGAIIEDKSIKSLVDAIAALGDKLIAK